MKENIAIFGYQKSHIVGYTRKYMFLYVDMLILQMICGFGKKLAPYQLFFAFPQLISRICHAQPEVFEQLKVGSLLYLVFVMPTTIRV